MKKRVAPRVSSAVRGHRRIICVTASAALLVPLLIDRSDGTPSDQLLQDDYTAAANEYQVPRSVLMGVSYLQSRWDSHHGAPSVVGGYGPMHLVDAPRPQPPQTPQHPQGQPRAGSAGPPAARPANPPADLQQAARLTGLPAEQLRTDDAANVRGGAALLAATQRQLDKPLSPNPGDWWETVARFPGTADRASADTYANDVFDVIRRGAHRTTDAGQRVTLDANPHVHPRRPVTKGTPRPKEVDCPPDLSCSWLSAPYVQIDDDEYGNHQLADRPKDQRIDYIVIHDTEAPLASMLQTIQDPEEASWHYSIRSRDGHITQHVRIRDAAWHSGSQFVNARSIGIEHEGFLRQPDAWYTETMYRSSARLVKYLARKYGVPLDRQHIFGHDNVPAPTEDTIPDMHDDPGPFWDWRHYFDLLGAPLKATAGPDSDVVMILPDYSTHTPRFTGCTKSGVKCAPHGSSAVRLHTDPAEDAPLIQDPGRHPDGKDSTEDVNDLGSRVSAGQTFAVAERSGDWTAIWYQGHKAWFKNPQAHPTAVGARGRTVTPKEGLREIEVFGRALPEEDAYPEGVDEQPEPSPLPYTLRAGQRYVTQSRVLGSYLEKPSSDDSPSPVVQGEEAYYEIQLGHRLAYVRARDVDVVKAAATAGPAGYAARTPLR
ncbi:N-acetylmuramoyl-L-alanine amidase [Streptomyces diastatochromogenes]|uniref:N-acetylmuramoyl-L-alanine amidase n=1 Tax=Streptomyces diastatochromogenes TaxID=42236 RepID=UPI000B918267|nr:peptidoglycan recognition family protein [Streptomyces diastatochromogenes]